LEQQPGLIKLADRIVEVELLQHFAHIRTEARNIIAQIRRQMGRVSQ